MRTIQVKLSTIRKAIERAKLVSSDWQAECCEILLIPAIAKRWRELNPNLRGLTIERVAGERYESCAREYNEERCKAHAWATIAGYVLVLMGEGESRLTWNSVRADYYGHSASTAWDGIRRDTISQFAYDLRMLAYGYDHAEMRRTLARVKIELVNDAVAAAA